MSEHLQEVPEGIGPSAGDMARWRAEFDKSQGADGFRLVGFRQVNTGEIMAIISATEETKA